MKASSSIVLVSPLRSRTEMLAYMLVLGAKEAEAGNVSVRDRKGETTTMEVDEFIAKVTSEIKNRSL